MKINIVNYGEYNIDKLNIKIFDSNNNLIINEYIFKLSYFDLDNGIYIIKIFFKYNLVSYYVVLHKYKNDIYNLCLCKNNDSIRVFYLYDYFYEGLKIERGELILGS